VHSYWSLPFLGTESIHHLGSPCKCLMPNLAGRGQSGRVPSEWRRATRRSALPVGQADIIEFPNRLSATRPAPTAHERDGSRQHISNFS
jgi:hypothetical protein